MSEQVTPPLVLKEPAHQSLIAEALSLYVGNWKIQGAIYGVTFSIGLVSAIVADLVLGMSVSYVALFTVGGVVTLIFLVPVVYVIIERSISYIGNGSDARLNLLRAGPFALAELLYLSLIIGGIYVSSREFPHESAFEWILDYSLVVVLFHFVSAILSYFSYTVQDKNDLHDRLKKRKKTQ